MTLARVGYVLLVSAATYAIWMYRDVIIPAFIFAGVVIILIWATDGRF